MKKTKKTNETKMKGSKPLMQTSKVELVKNKKSYLYRATDLAKTQEAFDDLRDKYAFGKLTTTSTTPTKLKRALKKLKRR